MALGVVGFAAVDNGSDQHGVCVDRATDQRVDDDECDDRSYGGGYGWYFIPVGNRAPAVGQPISGQGSFTTPTSGSFARGGVAADGGTVTRGGFRSGSGGFGG